MKHASTAKNIYDNDEKLRSKAAYETREEAEGKCQRLNLELVQSVVTQQKSKPGQRNCSTPPNGVQRTRCDGPRPCRRRVLSTGCTSSREPKFSVPRKAGKVGTMVIEALRIGKSG